MSFYQYDPSNQNQHPHITDANGLLRYSLFALVITSALMFTIYSVRRPAEADEFWLKTESVATGRNGLSEVELLQDEVQKLQTQIQLLQLEIATLTGQNGVIEQIIGHIGNLQAKDQALLEYFRGQENSPAVATAEGPDLPQAARHQIVTPRRTAEDKNSSFRTVANAQASSPTAPVEGQQADER